ncbi:unnamed protein product [Somion occarium]|uniref:Protein kinase domain-containing protein n=1 Tax=Somion occarium TaxID=3059160 RepID=A0ABP1CQB6_9APHY
MADSTASETAQTEGESPEGSDKPPHGNHIEHPSPLKQVLPASDKIRPNGAVHRQLSSKAAPPASPSAPNGSAGGKVPLPPAESHAFPKAPGTTRRDLEQLSQSTQMAFGGSPHIKHTAPSTTGSVSPSTSSSRSPSEYESSSVPSTQPPSRAPSRPPSRPSSFSAGKSGGKVEAPSTPSRPPSQKDSGKTASRASSTHRISPTSTNETTAAKRPPSVHSDAGQKFTLKDLLGAGPKLVRRSSARSTGSSKKSDSERGGRSSNGESTASLLKKYGVCEKVAIGKGATSVVRLAHKWDRSEEKLYAVKEFRKRRKNETEKEYVKKLTAEFCISSTLHHINIVETVDLVQDENLHWCEVMEFCPGGDLYAAIKRGGMSPAEVECCFKQILTGVSYLHSQGVAHRDIKPENLFFDTKGHLKSTGFHGSRQYTCPQVYVVVSPISHQNSSLANPTMHALSTSGHAVLSTIACTSRSYHGQSLNHQTSSSPLTSQHAPLLHPHRRNVHLPSTTSPPEHADHLYGRCWNRIRNCVYPSRTSCRILGSRQSRCAISCRKRHMCMCTHRPWQRRKCRFWHSGFVADRRVWRARIFHFSSYDWLVLIHVILFCLYD